MIKKLDAKLALLLTIVAALVVLMVGWFGLIASEQSKASKVDTQIAQSQDQLTSAQSLIATTSKAAVEAQFHAAQRILPTDPRMSQVLRELANYSASASTQVDAIVPGATTVVGTAQAVPITLSIEGQYFAIRHFLALLQTGATIKNNKILGSGRLYSVDSVQFTPMIASTTTASTPGTKTVGVQNSLSASIALDVYIAGAPPAPVATTPTTTTDSSSTSSDTTTTASGATP